MCCHPRAWCGAVLHNCLSQIVGLRTFTALALEPASLWQEDLCRQPHILRSVFELAVAPPSAAVSRTLTQFSHGDRGEAWGADGARHASRCPDVELLESELERLLSLQARPLRASAAQGGVQTTVYLSGRRCVWPGRVPGSLISDATAFYQV